MIIKPTFKNFNFLANKQNYRVQKRDYGKSFLAKQMKLFPIAISTILENIPDTIMQYVGIPQLLRESPIPQQKL